MLQVHGDLQQRISVVVKSINMRTVVYLMFAACQLLVSPRVMSIYTYFLLSHIVSHTSRLFSHGRGLIKDASGES